MADIKERIRKELEVQKVIDSACDYEMLLSFLDCIKYSSQWNSFVTVCWYRTGNGYDKCIRFYYPTEQLKNLFKVIKSS